MWLAEKLTFLQALSILLMQIIYESEIVQYDNVIRLAKAFSNMARLLHHILFYLHILLERLREEVRSATQVFAAQI